MLILKMQVKENGKPMGLGGRCLVFILNYPLVAYVKVCKTRVVGLGIRGPRLIGWRMGL